MFSSFDPLKSKNSQNHNTATVFNPLCEEILSDYIMALKIIIVPVQTDSLKSGLKVNWWLTCS